MAVSSLSAVRGALCDHIDVFAAVMGTQRGAGRPPETASVVAPTGAPNGTRALVRAAKAAADGGPALRETTSEHGAWLHVTFEVVEGAYAGTLATFPLRISAGDHKLRAVTEIVLGIDLVAGGAVQFSDFKDRLLDGTFEVELGPSHRNGVPTGRTAVSGIISRVSH